MRLEILFEGEATSVELADGRARIGGSPDDEVRLEGLPPSLVRLLIEGDRLTVTASRALTIGAAPFPARVPRLLVAGEDLELPNGARVRRAGDREQKAARLAADTAVVAKGLLAGSLTPERTRAAILTCVTGPDQGVVFPLAFSESVIGRGDGADLRLRDRSVSRQHARLRRRGHRYLVEAMTAANGLYRNGLRLETATELSHGDVIELGRTLLRFDGPAEAEAEPAEPAEAAEAPKVAAVEVAGPVQAPSKAADGGTTAAPAPPEPVRFEQGLIALGAVMAAGGLVVAMLMLL